MPHERLQAAKRSIVKAIQQGAPLYNKGDVKGCELLYRATYDELLASRGLAKESPEVASILNRQLEQLRKGEVDKNAWLLRYGFDAILELDTVFAAGSTEGGEFCPIIQCSSSRAADYFSSMDDGVMGGVSKGSTRFSQSTRSVAFSGSVSTANNGGFSSIRSRQAFPLAIGYTGIYIDCKTTDATKVFQLVAKDVEAVQTRVSFKAPFKAPSGDFGRVLIPFSALDSPTQMGRPVLRKPMNLAALAEVGFMISKPSTGKFELFFREIGLYK